MKPLALLLLLAGCTTMPNSYIRFYKGNLEPVSVCIFDMEKSRHYPQGKCGPVDVMIPLIEDMAKDAKEAKDKQRFPLSPDGPDVKGKSEL